MQRRREEEQNLVWTFGPEPGGRSTCHHGTCHQQFSQLSLNMTLDEVQTFPKKVISHLSVTFHTRDLKLKFHSSSGEGERSQDQLKSLFKNVTLETTTMRLDNSEICILLKNFTKTKACDPGGYAAAAVEIIVHQGRSVVDTLVAFQKSINSDQFRS